MTNAVYVCYHNDREQVLGKRCPLPGFGSGIIRGTESSAPRFFRHFPGRRIYLRMPMGVKHGVEERQHMANRKNSIARDRLARRIFAGNIALNVALAAGKISVGLLAGSGALVSDGVDSASDVFSTLVVMAGMYAAGQDSDAEHPFGHERFECVASLILSLMMAVSGVGIGISGVKKIFTAAETLAAPGFAALVAAFVSLAVKAYMYANTRSAAKKLNSSALLADAANYLGDALAAAGVLAGVLGARLGLVILDPAAGVVICALILRSAFRIARDALSRMTDTACDAETEEKMRRVIEQNHGVNRIDRLRTRLFGSRIYVEVEISADGGMSLNDAHAIAQRVHDSIEAGFPDVKHCMVHVNPAET